MFGNARQAISAYQKVGVDAAVEVADPHRLILLLFAGAQAAIGKARAAMQQRQIAVKGEAISKAIDIIANGLKVSLDLEKGGRNRRATRCALRLPGVAPPAGQRR
jgi:flagellar protein FliS